MGGAQCVAREGGGGSSLRARQCGPGLPVEAVRASGRSCRLKRSGPGDQYAEAVRASVAYPSSCCLLLLYEAGDVVFACAAASRPPSPAALAANGVR